MNIGVSLPHRKMIHIHFIRVEYTIKLLIFLDYGVSYGEEESKVNSFGIYLQCLRNLKCNTCSH